MQGLWPAHPAACDSDAHIGFGRRSFSLRKLRADFAYAGADSSCGCARPRGECRERGFALVTTRRPAISRSVGLFGDADPDRKPLAAQQASIDGGSRGNPGPAAYGVVVRDAGGEIVARLKKYIGRSTNNVAEYFGLIAALDYAQTHDLRSLHVESDSELLVKQMRGQYRVKSPELQPLFERAKKISQSLASFRINHVYREQNREADALANE